MSSERRTAGPGGNFPIGGLIVVRIAVAHEIEAFATPGLGDTSYLLSTGTDAILVDPQRDAWRFLAAAEARGLAVRFVLETHVHNDYLSGAGEIRAATGAEIVAPARGNWAFPHRPVAEGDEIDLEGLRVVAMETPGHTPEHVSYLVREDAGEPAAIFTGGSLILGAAGRTDLLGPERTEELTRSQFRSLGRLSGLPDVVLVLPTHGVGSFCASASVPGVRQGPTLGEQRRTNQALVEVDEDAFVEQQIAGLPLYPAYYRYMAPINRSGPPPLGSLPGLGPLSPDEVAARADAGAWIVDGRERLTFAAAHIPGSINVELDDEFASYVGWVVPFGARLVLVLPEPPSDAAEQAMTQLIRVGYEQVEGYLAGGVAAWRVAGKPVASYPTSDVRDLPRSAAEDGRARVLDVRQPSEWERGVIPGSTQIFVGDLPGREGEVPADAELWVICASGHRSAVAASLLDRAGTPVRLVARGGVTEFLRSAG
jgi:hydroxyacylglutathione hydrolase